jgi:hypothetical protein
MLRLICSFATGTIDRPTVVRRDHRTSADDRSRGTVAVRRADARPGLRHRLRRRRCGPRLAGPAAVSGPGCELDISLVQGWPNADQARILTAVSAYAERSGATILAEGIETDVHLQQALALSARLGQGWLFSPPGPLGSYPPAATPVSQLPAPEAVPETPFELLDPRRVRVGSKGLLLSISRHIEQQGHNLQTPPLVLAAFQDAARFTPATAVRYATLAARCPLVVALGAGMPAAPAPGVRGAHLTPTDRLREEWTVIVVGAHYTGALIAKDLGDSGPDLDRRFMFALTHDHDAVLAAARILLGRVQAQ